MLPVNPYLGATSTALPGFPVPVHLKTPHNPPDCIWPTKANAEPEERIVSKETRTISDLVNAISDEMTRLDYKPTVLKQYHIVWNKLQRVGVRPANDFDMEFGMNSLTRQCMLYPKHLNENSKHRWIKAIYTLADSSVLHPFSRGGKTRICLFRNRPILRSSNSRRINRPLHYPKRTYATHASIWSVSRNTWSNSA